MAKRNEFKPDKPRSGFLSKLYLTQLQRRAILKWLRYALVLVGLSVAQDVILCRVRIFGATTDLVPCCILAVCILQGAESGCIFALVGSMLYYFSGSAPGAYCVVLLTALGVDRETASEDACRIEHVISEQTFEAIKRHIRQE